MNQLEDPVPVSCAPIPTCRATVCLWSESMEEKVEFTTWLHRWRKSLSYLSHDYGCGCCLHLFDLEGPVEAVAALPPEMRCVSTWTENAVRPPPLRPP